MAKKDYQITVYQVLNKNALTFFLEYKGIKKKNCLGCDIYLVWLVPGTLHAMRSPCRTGAADLRRLRLVTAAPYF